MRNGVVGLQMSGLEEVTSEVGAGEAMFRAIFQQSADAMIVFSGSPFDVVQANVAARELLCVDASDDESAFDANLVFEKLGCCDHPLEEALERARDGELAYETRCTCPSGASILPRWIDVRLTPVSLGTREAILATFRDITERKRNEEREEELERQIEQARKLEAVGRLAGGIAHDFNNLLAIVMSYTDLAISFLDDDDVVDDLLQVRQAAKKASHLTRKLLVLGRKDISQPQRVDLNDAIRALTPLLQSSLGGHHQFRARLRDSVGIVEVDPVQLDQLLVNFTVNARDAMGHHGGEFMIETSRVDCPDGVELDGDTCVRLRISDSGKGMTPEVRDRIFDPYFTTKDSGSGTGLGMAVAYSVIAAVGGTIHVDSEVGEGTTFDCYLPAKKRFEDVETLNTQSIPVEDLPSVIMLVEDEQALREALVRTLETHGHEVFAYSRAEEAFEEFEKLDGAIDLVITDCALPGMDGLELARRLREISPELPICLVTGYSESLSEMDILHDDYTDMMLKPFRPEALLRVVRTFTSA